MSQLNVDPQEIAKFEAFAAHMVGISTLKSSAFTYDQPTTLKLD